MTVYKFKVGDRVYTPFHGYGTVTKIHEDKCVYPIIVTWDDTNVPFMEDVSSFTEDGCLLQYSDNDNTVLKVVDKESMEEDKKFMKECEKMDAESKKFKVGDKVWSFHFGVGIVISVADEANTPYPIKVQWTEKARSPNTYDYFTSDGKFNYRDAANEDFSITLSEANDEDSAINPAYYQVEGIPEAIDIMAHLMTKEQFEGFLWGNIIKYAYRYGRKGDKAETAGKIKLYAQKLKELVECESK